MLVGADVGAEGTLIGTFPVADSELHFDGFFPRIYRAYDERFVYAAPSLASHTKRSEWAPESSVFNDPRITEFETRVKHE